MLFTVRLLLWILYKTADCNLFGVCNLHFSILFSSLANNIHFLFFILKEKESNKNALDGYVLYRTRTVCIYVKLTEGRKKKKIIEKFVIAKSENFII